MPHENAGRGRAADELIIPQRTPNPLELTFLKAASDPEARAVANRVLQRAALRDDRPRNVAREYVESRQHDRRLEPYSTKSTPSERPQTRPQKLRTALKSGALRTPDLDAILADLDAAELGNRDARQRVDDFLDADVIDLLEATYVR